MQPHYYTVLFIPEDQPRDRTRVTILGTAQRDDVARAIAWLDHVARSVGPPSTVLDWETTDSGEGPYDKAATDYGTYTMAPAPHYGSVTP